MPRNASKKNGNALVEMKKELKELKAQIKAEKEKRREATAVHKEKIREKESELGRDDFDDFLENFNRQAAIENAKKTLEKTRTELKARQIELEVLSAEKDYKETIRRLETRNNQLEDALKNGIELKPWKQCEACFVEFEEEGDKVPKILNCGHTFCSGCIRRLAKPDYIQCPVDETIFVFTDEYGIDNIVKNYTALSM